MKTETGCSDCDITLSKFPYVLCPKCELERLKWVAESAQNDYLNELKAQSRKGTRIRKETK